MTRADFDDLVDLAGRISDGSRIEWDHESGRRPELLPLIDQLRRLETVAAAHRAVITEPSPGSKPATVDPEPTSAAAAENEPTNWGPLRLLERIGQGGFGEVYRAYDPSLRREVALKLLYPYRAADRQAAKRHLDEARRLARIRHPNVIVVHGADRHHGRVGLWMDLIRGQTLEQLLAERGPFQAGEAAMIGVDLCRALSALHAAGLVYRDLKTNNVMREHGGRIVLMDFGAAGETRGGSIDSAITDAGTLWTMAPEQIRGGRVGPKADLYALGILLYRLGTGGFPFAAANLAELYARRVRNEWIPLRDARPDLPVDFVRVVERALEPDPERRFASAGAMERALGDCVGGESVRPALPQSSFSSRSRRTRLVLLVGALVVATLGGALLLSWWLGRTASSQRSATATGAAASRRAESSTDGKQTSPEVEPSSAVRIGSPPNPASEGLAREAPAALHAAGTTPRQLSLTASAALFRFREGHRDLLAPGDRVRVGDGLSLEIESSDPMYVYVLDEDERGGPYVLFPLAGVDESNPLAGGLMHRLPGRMRGAAFDWQVNTAGGKEQIVVIAARAPVRSLEREIAGFVHATPERAVTYDEISQPAMRNLRAAIGMVEETSSDSDLGIKLSDLVRRLSQPRSPEKPWVWGIELETTPP